MVTSNGHGKPTRLGILGGTFDPVHNGHLALAEYAFAKLRLTQVIFIPTGQPWMKSGRDITPASDRIGMLHLAIDVNPNFHISGIEILRKGPTYTIDTLTELSRQTPESTELYFIISWNTLEEFPRWKDPKKIIKLCRLVVAPRPGYQKPDLAALEAKIKGITEKIVLLDKPAINISATEIRERVKKGLPVSEMVPAAVAEYIREKRLYL
ncbi:MAG: nicotinate-nucleotide adenylyltransferase [Dehalococcoidales bacterium]|nr:nicotinate-nucleotide adenylyltransferase [Dehalococcoidales bacterium]